VVEWKLPTQFHCTVSPAWIVSTFGENLLPPCPTFTVTVTPEGVAVAVGVLVGVGVEVGVGGAGVAVDTDGPMGLRNGTNRGHRTQGADSLEDIVSCVALSISTTLPARSNTTGAMSQKRTARPLTRG
jgi:hypothetical protein